VKDTISKVGQIQDTYQGQRIRIESNPEISIGESIADIEAMNVVSNMFDYKTRIAGSHFSPSQLFFLNIAQVDQHFFLILPKSTIDIFVVTLDPYM